MLKKIVTYLAYRLALDLIYVVFVSQFYAYAGFDLKFTFIKYFESMAILLFVILGLPKTSEKASDLLIVFYVTAALVPLLVLYAMTDGSRYVLYLSAFATMVIMAIPRSKNVSLPPLVTSNSISQVMLLGLVATTSIWMIYSGGTVFMNFDLKRVYEFRHQSNEIISNGLMGYLVSWTTKVFGAVLMAIFLSSKKYLAALAIVALYIFWFAVTNVKSVLFYPVVIAAVWVWCRYSRDLLLIPMCALTVVLVSLCAVLFFDDLQIASWFIRRTLFVPAQLTFVYVEFFSSNEKIFWANSLTSTFMDYPYELKPAQVIGDYMRSKGHANTYFIGSGFMHAGPLGVVAYGVIVGALLWLADCIAKNRDLTIALSALVIPARSMFMNSDLPTVVLTHGFALALVCIYLCSPKMTNRASVQKENPNWKLGKSITA